ncbi:glycosyltransferase family 4 protein [bacterium]|nr:glycosyltransferase family 4 protein [bacterium]
MEEKKNILYISSFPSLQGGGQRSLLLLLEYLDRESYTPYLMAPCEGELTEAAAHLGVNTFSDITQVLNFPKIMTLRFDQVFDALYELYRFCKKMRIDLIHTDGPRNAFYGGIVARLQKIPMIWHIRASNRDRYDRLLYQLSSKIILVAQVLRRRFQWVKTDDKFVTIYNGIDLSLFLNDNGNRSIRRQYGIGNEELLISVAARVERLKGQKFLIEACVKLKSLLPNYRILIAGEITEPLYQRECRELAAANGIEDNVIFTGHLENIVPILNTTDIFVLPSLFEAVPRALIEAMGAGRPVVATDVGGCTEAIENEVSGFIVPPANAPALADVLLELGKDKQLRVDIGKAARIRAEKKFNIEENVKQTEQVYHELLAGGQDVNASD